MIANARGGAWVPVRGCALVHAGLPDNSSGTAPASSRARAAKLNERRIVATTDQTVSGVPGRYASALFELATEEKATEEVGRQLAKLRAPPSSSRKT